VKSSITDFLGKRAGKSLDCDNCNNTTTKTVRSEEDKFELKNLIR